MKNRFYQVMQQITWVGAFLILAFAVKTFYQAIPDEIYIEAGEKVSYEFDVPVSVVLKEEEAAVFENLAQAGAVEKAPGYTVTCKLFGIFPIKDVEVRIAEGEKVYASGLPIGIYVKTDGILVLGTSRVTDTDGRECYPAQNLIKSGDYIVSVNGESVYEKEELMEKIDAYGEEREILGIRRGGEYIEVSLTPVESEQGRHLLGIWVRDDLAGVGTLTYYADIVGIKRGQNGVPGELSGVIDYGKGHCLGKIIENSQLGIRGKLDRTPKTAAQTAGYDVCYKQDIRIGTAYIISAVSGEYETYEIQIESLDYSGKEENKGILFRVTDPKLLELTGGIVQGMSGSPIIQDGKMIGAVTHVFVSDASQGYGIFIEKMLKE